MVWLLLASLALLFFIAIMIGGLVTKQVGTEAQTGPRDELPPPTIELGRARRALANLYESLPIFLTLGILIIIYSAETTVTFVAGLVFVVARIAHLYFYMRAISPARSYAYLAGMLALFVMAGGLIWRLIAG
ncbi:MAG: hypothetical protein JWR75_1856 [Devosia sp.]|nr:hypothetical protein [Devosia sp.]